MQNTLKQCPQCGSSLVKYTNKNTHKYFTRCSNKDCHFSLRDNYYEEEIPLQGIELQTTCSGCGHPLEIACGPLGLYARCYHCDYDSTPHCIDGELAVRWANAYSKQAKNEIENLIIQYKKKKETQIGFEEEDYRVVELASNSTSKGNSQYLDIEKELVLAGFTGKSLEYCGRILEVFMQDTSKPLGSKDIFEKLREHINSVCSVINSLKALRNSNFIKIVKYEENSSSFKIYYQIKSSPLEEIKVYTKDEGYASISSFFKNSDFYSTSKRTQVARVLRSNNEPTFLVQHERGFYVGYKIETLEKIIKNLETNFYKKDENPVLLNKEVLDVTNNNNNSSNLKRDKEYNKKIRQKIIEILNKNLNTGYAPSEIGELLNVRKKIISDSMRTLERQNKVKVVGTELRKGRGNYSYVYQLVESSLEQITVKTTRGCLTIKEFQAKHKKELGNKSYFELLQKVRKNNLSEYLVLVHKRPHVGYKESDLKQVFGIKETAKISKEFKNTKKSTDISIEPEVSLQINEDTRTNKNFLLSILKIFKKEKQNNPEIIHF